MIVRAHYVQWNLHVASCIPHNVGVLIYQVHFSVIEKDFGHSVHVQYVSRIADTVHM